MPLFNNQNLFGTSVRTRRGAGERMIQKNSFGGLNGIEALDMGSRGRVTTVTGRFVCPDVPTLNAAILTAESYVDGNAYVFVDQFGNAWPYVQMVEFAITGELNAIAGIGGFTVPYTAKFEHLI